VKGITENRSSSFFTPPLTNVSLGDDNSNYKLIFTGGLFVPCSLNYTVRNESNVDDDDGRRKSNENEEIISPHPMCSWDGSLIDVKESDGSLELLTITDSVNGGLSVEKGNLTMKQCQFENNSPRYELFPSFRKKLIMKAEWLVCWCRSFSYVLLSSTQEVCETSGGRETE
jgi:hypothetical protein